MDLCISYSCDSISCVICLSLFYSIMYEQLELPFEDLESKESVLLKKTKKELIEIIKDQEVIIQDLKYEVEVAKNLGTL